MIRKSIQRSIFFVSLLALVFRFIQVHLFVRIFSVSRFIFEFTQVESYFFQVHSLVYQDFGVKFAASFSVSRLICKFMQLYL